LRREDLLGGAEKNPLLMTQEMGRKGTPPLLITLSHMGQMLQATEEIRVD
jgi:hypothetical protein